MGSIGRNITILQGPIYQHRLGRFKNGSAAVRQGVPVIADTYDSYDGRTSVEVAVNDDSPVVGQSGILIYEAPWTGWHGVDPESTSFSDLDVIPADAPAQLIHGTEVRIRFQNTDPAEGGRRVISEALVGSLSIGDALVPHASPSDVNGEWQAASSDDAWLVVTAVDEERDYVEVQLQF